MWSFELEGTQKVGNSITLYYISDHLGEYLKKKNNLYVIVLTVELSVSFVKSIK